MAGIARILPRDWDGRRLLQFLAGLALIALSFAGHLGVGVVASTPPAAVYTAAVSSATDAQTAEPSAPRSSTSGSSTSGSSTSGSLASGRPAVGAADPGPGGDAATTRHPTTADVAGAAAGRSDSAALAVAGPAFTAEAAIAVLPSATGVGVLPVGVARGVLGSRAPPRG